MIIRDILIAWEITMSRFTGIVLAMPFALAGCGGAGNNPPPVNTTPPPPVVEVVVFIDPPVQGLTYQPGSEPEGMTAANGMFDCDVSSISFDSGALPMGLVRCIVPLITETIGVLN